METFAKWLRDKRKSLRLTQEELAKQAGFSRTYIVTLESGKVALPNQPTRARLHHALGTTEDELIADGVLAHDEYGAEFSPAIAQLHERFDLMDAQVKWAIQESKKNYGRTYDEIMDQLVRGLSIFALTKEREAFLRTLFRVFYVDDHLEDDGPPKLDEDHAPDSSEWESE